MLAGQIAWSVQQETTRKTLPQPGRGQGPVPKSCFMITLKACHGMCAFGFTNTHIHHITHTHTCTHSHS